MKRCWFCILAFFLGCSLLAQPVNSVPANDPEINSIFQYFAAAKTPGANPHSGAYLWIPPATPKIRAVMVGIHNGIPLPMLQNPAIRKVCRNYGIAQILFVPNDSDIGSIMLKDLNFDVTDPAKTKVYDHYLQVLADASGHPELSVAPIVPLAHSAYMDFAFDAAMRNPDRCLAAIPIKSGVPDKYAFYAPGGKSKVPDATRCLRQVPVLVVCAASQETVAWSQYPHGFDSFGFIGCYRRDYKGNPGTAYEPRNDLVGACWEMMDGHFELSPRSCQFVAAWLEAVAAARLPNEPGAPLKELVLRDGWLMDPRIPVSGDVDSLCPAPARYLEFKGDRQKALWFPNESLARGLYELLKDEPRRNIELFTVRDPKGEPVSLAHGLMAEMPDAGTLLLAKGDGRFALTTYHYTTPPGICSIKEKGHGPEDKHLLVNLLFPDKATLPLSGLPLQFNPNGTPLELLQQEEITDDRGVTETRFTLKIKRNRFWPDPGFQMLFPRIYHAGNRSFAAAGRTVKIVWVPQDVGKNRVLQTLNFPPLPDVSAKTAKIELKATSSAGLPIDYFVQKGPGIIQHGVFVPAEVPVGSIKPIEVTIGAYQAGIYKEDGGIKPSPTVYQTFRLIP